MLKSEILKCVRCPRLVAHHEQVRQIYPRYHARPVASWGDPRPQLLLVGLAPGLHGAANTGKAFVGDASGSFLFAALHRAGFADSPSPDQARLLNARLTNAVKCLPPDNAPQAGEVACCQSFLVSEIEQFAPPGARKPRVILALGGIAYRAVQRASKVPAPVPKFEHGLTIELDRSRVLMASYHPSRLNVNTGRLNGPMLDTLLWRCREIIER